MSSIEKSKIVDLIYDALDEHGFGDIAYEATRRIFGRLSAEEANECGCGDIFMLESIKTSLLNEGMSHEEICVVMNKIEKRLSMSDRIRTLLIEQKSNNFARNSIERIFGFMSTEEANNLGCSDDIILEHIKISLKDEDMYEKDIHKFILEVKDYMHGKV